MIASRLVEALELCGKIGEMNKTVYLVQELQQFIRKNRRNITKETKIARSKVRRTFGKLESHIVDMLMRLCNYTCPKHNVELVHQLMTALGYGGYEKENRFRQRTENTLKKWKRIKTVVEEEEELADYSLDESGEGVMGDALVCETQLRDSAQTKEKTVASDGDPSHCMNGSDREERSSTLCANVISAHDYEPFSFGLDQGDLLITDRNEYGMYCFNEWDVFSERFYDFYCE